MATTELDSPLRLTPGADFRATFIRVTGAVIVTLGGTGLGGHFDLTYGGDVTGDLAPTATATAVRMALEALSNLGPGGVTVSGSAGGPWTIAPAGQTSPGAFTGTDRVGYVNALTGTAPTITVALEPRDITGFTYDLQARDLAGETTADVRIQSVHWTYADEAARAAAGGFSAADVGLLAAVSADGTQWRLTAVTPTWAAVTPVQGEITNGGTDGTVGLHIRGTATAALDFTDPSHPTNNLADLILMEDDGTDQTAVLAGPFLLLPQIWKA